MKNSDLLALFLAFNAGAAGCGADDTPFLPLDKLCPTIAETVCEARSGCCDEQSTAQSDCIDDVREACDEERVELTQESSLSYDGERAESVHDELRESVRSCEPPFALSRFFEGGKALGEGCERDPECGPGLCNEGTCQKGTLAPLCESDEP